MKVLDIEKAIGIKEPLGEIRGSGFITVDIFNPK